MTRRVWAGGIGSLVALDLYAAYVRHDGTLSHTVRETLRTNTAEGRVLLCLGWATLTAWLLPHLCVWPEDRR